MLNRAFYHAWRIGACALLSGIAITDSTSAGQTSAPTVAVTAFQHMYLVSAKPPITTTIQDSIQSSTSPTWSPVWNDPVTWVSTITAPDGYRFVVTPAMGFGAPTTMHLATNWNTFSTVLDFTVYFGATSFTFNGLSGTPPTTQASSSVAGQALYTLDARANLQVSAPFSFTSITFTTTPSFNFAHFPLQSYYPVPDITLSAVGSGSLADATLISLQQVPEPSSIVLATVAVAGLLTCGWRRKQT